MHVIPKPLDLVEVGKPIGREVVSHFDQRAEAIISDARSLLAGERDDPKAEMLRHRDPPKAIQAVARDGEYDLIVMGNGEDDRWQLDTVGDVAEKVARWWERSILIVKKTRGFSRISVVVEADGEKGIFELVTTLARDFGSQFKVIWVSGRGNRSGGAGLEAVFRMAGQMGLSPQVESMVRRDLNRLNETLAADLTQLVLIRRPVHGIVGRVLRRGESPYRILLSCHCSVLLCP